MDTVLVSWCSGEKNGWELKSDVSDPSRSWSTQSLLSALQVLDLTLPCLVSEGRDCSEGGFGFYSQNSLSGLHSELKRFLILPKKERENSADVANSRASWVL